MFFFFLPIQKNFGKYTCFSRNFVQIRASFISLLGLKEVSMISVDKISVQFGERILFQDVSFMINPKDRIGLTGKNGAGKSTLLKILSGLQKADSGRVIKSNDTSIGYLPQHMTINDECSLLEETQKAFAHINEIEEKIEKLNTALAERSDYESEEYMQLIHEVSDLNDRYQIMGGSNRNQKTEQTLKGLGFGDDDFNRHTSTFSGGWRMRIELAKILLQAPSVILLDEPTNHLDIESIQWLEQFLKDYPGIVILISHDRRFLDTVTQRTLEISLGKIFDFNVSYSKYLVQREEQREQQLAAYQNQQKKIEDTREFIERFRYKATKAVQVQSRIKQLNKMDVIEVEENENAVLNIRFPDAPRGSREVYRCRNMVKKYGDKMVLNGIDFLLERGEKVAFVGKNGEGKSTLSKIIVGDTNSSGGESKLGANISIGYFAQNQDELLDESKTVFQTIDDVAVGDIRTKIRDILGAFLFSGEDIDKKVSVLSGGEKSRLAMAKLMLEPYNLLVLDEPTNHLDMVSKDILKLALLKYNGSLIIVSHDRYFLEGLTHKVVEFKNNKTKETIGDVNDFLEKKRIESLNELEKKQKTVDSANEKSVSNNKQNYLERKEADKEIRKIKTQIGSLEKKINETETVIAEMEAEMAIPENMSDSNKAKELSTKYNSIKHNLDKLLYEWEILSEQVDELEEKRKAM
jgi:ATP-binding cassette subfamily F protein 3